MNTKILRIPLLRITPLKEKCLFRPLIAAAALIVGLPIIPIHSALVQDPTATRIVPNPVALGEPFTVQIQTAPGTGQWTLFEQIPTGFVVQDISHGGRFVPSMRQIHWGPFPNAIEEPLQFRLVPSQLGLGTSVVQFGGPGTGIAVDPLQFPHPVEQIIPASGAERLNLAGAVFPDPALAPTPGPLIISHPLDQTVGIGRTTTLIVNATGREPLSFQWFVNGRPIPGATAPQRIFHDLRLRDSGIIFVVITDRDGRATVSRPVILHVIDPQAPPPSPVIVKHPKDQTVREGHHALFSVEATGTSPLSFQWFHNGHIIHGAVAPVLELLHVSPNDQGAYHVRVTDGQGNTALSHAAILTVRTPEPFTIVRDEHPHLRKIYNLAGAYSDNLVSDEVEIDLEYTLSHNQLGRLTGTGVLTFTTPETTITTDLHVHGRIRTIGHPDETIHQVVLTHRASEESTFEITLKQVAEIDGVAPRMIGEVQGEAILGEETYPIHVDAHQTQLPPDRDENWTLSVTPPTTEEPTGHAMLHVQGDELHYEVTKRPLPTQNLDVFHLRGKETDSRGSNIRLDIDARDEVARMFGQAKGQHLNALLEHDPKK